VAKADSTVDSAMLEFCLREDLNKKAPRRMVVMDPILLVIQNYPDGQSEMLDAENNPEAPETGHRKISFSKRIYIEREDFMENAPKKFFRMTLGNEVRLKHAYYVKCTDIIKDENGNVKELHCTYDSTTKGGWSEDGRKVKGTIHWVNAEDCIDVELRTFDYLFNTELEASTPEEEEDLLFGFNKNSLHVNIAKAENNLLNDPADVNFQFIRKGYYIKDKDSSASKLVFNETVGMKDSWNKTQTN
jgi:glutaminyl-tRNA synthetase